MSGPQKRPITRNREMLACTNCRTRKLKCDRNDPCNSCVKRGDEANCAYQRYARGLGNERQRRIEAESRLEHLEQLVQQLAQPESSTGDPSQLDTVNFATSTLGGTASSNGASPSALLQASTYSGSTHWSAMLEDIEELRFAMGADDVHLESNGTESLSAVDVLFGARVTLSLDQVLDQYLPSRQEADRLIAAYFRAKAISAPFIHSSQFGRQYQAFWQDPFQTPPLWTSIFFTICDIASSTLMPPSGSGNGCVRYSIAAAHCLAIGGYFRPKRFAVEALLLFAQSQLFTSLDIPPDVATIISLVVRLASELGYHREPQSFAMSPFEQEMRRRAWSLCIQLDLLTAFQFGLPSTVQFPTWDTKSPANLLDSDFDEHSAVLPPPRPDNELTDIIFYNGKHRLVVVFEKVLRNALSTNEEGIMHVDQLDAETRATYATLPEILRPRSMSESVTDPSWLTVTRLCVRFMFQKCLCVLHRKYVIQGRVISIRTCYEASSELVRFFVDAYDEFTPGGQNESERWFLSSITWHDFLLGSTVLCLVVCASTQSNLGVSVDRGATLELLRRSQKACIEQSKPKSHTQRATRVVSATIALLEAQSELNQYQLGYANPSTGQTPSSGMFTAQSEYGGLAQTSSIQPAVQDLPDSSGAYNWSWSEDLSKPVEDPSWSYLEQYLNLSNTDEFMHGL